MKTPRPVKLVGKLQIIAAVISSGVVLSCSDPSVELGSTKIYGSVTQPILDGVDDVEHLGVLALTHQPNSNSSLCTASLIAPNLVLTARHCVSSVLSDSVTCASEAAADSSKRTSLFGSPYSPSRIGVSTDIGVGPGTDWILAREVIVPDGSDEICGNDVALVILERNIDNVDAMIPRIDQRAGGDEVFVAVGYGVTAPNNGRAGRRRIREGLEVFCIHPFCPAVQVTESEFVADLGVCQGDSGGPAIDDEGRIFGVISRSGASCNYPLYAEVAVWKDWLIAGAERASELGGYALPHWAATGSSEAPPDPPPEDSSDAPDEQGFGPGAGAAAGDSCGGSDDCATDQLCVAPGGDVENAICADICAAADDCSAQMFCDSSTGSCAPITGADPLPESGCSVAAASVRSARHNGAVIALLVTFGCYLGRRRSRRRSRRKTLRPGALAMASAVVFIAGCAADGSGAGGLEGVAGSGTSASGGAPGGATGGARGGTGGTESTGGSSGTTAGGAGGKAGDGPGGGSSGGGAGGTDAGPKQLSAEVWCTPSGDVCAPATKASQVFASYRKDAYFEDAIYNEYTEPPVNGGRVHVIATAEVSGEVTGYTIGGIDPDIIYTEDSGETPPFEWTHIWPTRVQAGDPIWVSFHSRDANWDSVTSSRLIVQTDAGVAVDASFPVAETGPVRLTYVTFEDDFRTAVLHLKNTGNAPHDIARVVFNGRDVTADDVACVPYPKLLAGESARITVPLCEAASAGDVWTVAVEFEQTISPAAGGGRVLSAFFPVEAWNNTTECPWPEGNEQNAAALTVNGIDTHYMHGGVCKASNCDCSTSDVLDIYASDPRINVLVTDDIITAIAPIADTSGIAAVSTGDESDGEVYDDDGVPNAAKKAATARRLWALHPELPVFNGGKTNGHVGTFAGMTDIQGMDVYIGGCAPHITAWGTHPPVRMPFDYLRNTRNNHMPLPTWLYAQGLSPVGAWKAQPSPSEVMAQGVMVIAAGGKGLMWFQANQEKAAAVPASWQAMEDVNRITRGVRHWLRVGDPVGYATSTADDIVESIPAGDAIVVPVISLDVTQAPDDLACALISRPHVWASVMRDVTVQVPRDMDLRALYEVTPSGAVPVHTYSVSERRVTIHDVRTDDAMPARVFVLAGSDDAAARIDSAMTAF